MNEQTKKRITVIDDNEPDVFLLKESLDQAGVNYEILSIDDGEQGRNYILGPGNDRPPDLLLIDLNLPRLDGAEILRTISRQPSMAGVPVVVWSSVCDTRVVDEFKVRHFVTKPSSLDAFGKIGELIRDILASA